MEFLNPHDRNYLKRLSGTFFHKYTSAQLRQATSLPSISTEKDVEEAARDLQLQKQRIEAELEIFTTETLAYSKRRSKYHAVTIPLSVKNQVTETPSTMARPRSPQRKNEVNHEHLQSLLDEQLSVIRQQLNSLSSERAKMEQKMEDLTNGIKEAQGLSAQCVPRFIITGSTPGNIRRAHSVESRRPNLIKTDSQLSLKWKANAETQILTSPPIDEVDGEGIGSKQFQREKFTSTSSLGSLKDSDTTTSPSDSVLSSSTGTTASTSHRFRFHPASVSDDNFTPTPIPELPESPSILRPISPHIYATYSPRSRPRAASSSTPSPLKLHSSPNHQRMFSQPAPSQLSLAHTLLSPPENNRTRSNSFSLLASPRLALKATLSSQDLRNRSSSSPSAKKKSPPSSSKLRQSKHKDQRLSYFRKNSLTDLDSSLKGSQLSITDDECELKGSIDNLSQLSSSNNNNTPEHDISPKTPPTTSSARILRRSSLTGQIEHVSNPKTFIRRNSSFNTSPSTERAKHASLWERRTLSINRGTTNNPRSTSKPDTSTATASLSLNAARVVYLDSKETTV